MKHHLLLLLISLSACIVCSGQEMQLLFTSSLQVLYHNEHEELKCRTFLINDQVLLKADGQLVDQFSV